MYGLINTFKYKTKEKCIINNEEMMHNFILPLFKSLNWEKNSFFKLNKKEGDYDLFNLGVLDEKCFLLGVSSYNNKESKFKDDEEVKKKILSIGYNKKIDWIILSNFEETLIYNNRWQKEQNESAVPFRHFSLSDYIGSDIKLFDRDVLISGNFVKIVQKEEPRKKLAAIDDYLLENLIKYRDVLFLDIVKNIEDSEKDMVIFNLFNSLFLTRIFEDKLIIKKRLLDTINRSNFKETLWNQFKLIPYKKIKQKDIDLFSVTNLKSLVRSFYASNLYYTYDFSLIEDDVLGLLYEKYLGLLPHFKDSIQPRLIKEVGDGSVVYEGKQKTLGIYYTPNYISKFITNISIDKWLEKNEYDEKLLRVIDLSCGSGTFLVNSINRIVEKKYYSRYKNFDEFLRNTIYGIDIDPKAVETTNLNIIQNAVIEGLNGREEHDLSKNLLNKDSLLDFNNDTKFDISVGNPPYTTSVEKNKKNIEDLKNTYSDIISGNFNTFELFIKKSIDILNDGGVIGYIVPRVLLSRSSSEKLRNYILDNCKIDLIIDLTDQEVFKNASVYTIIIILKKLPKKLIDNTSVKVLKVNNLQSSFETLQIKASLEKIRNTDNEELIDVNIAEQKKYWQLISKDEFDVLKRINLVKTKLKDVADVSQGVKTGMDKFFIVDVVSRGRGYVEVRNSLDHKSYKIEDKFVKNYIGSKNLSAFKINYGNKALIYPYINGKSIALSDMKSKYKLIYNYFLSQKEQLESRASLKDKSNWHLYSRNQALKMNKRKLISPCNSFRSSFCYDESGIFFITGGVSGGNTIILKNKYIGKYKYLLGVLNSDLFDWFVQNKSDMLRGKYYSYEPKYINDFPVKQKGREIKEIEKTVDEILLINDSNELNIDNNLKNLMIKLNELVYSLYGINYDEIYKIDRSLKLLRSNKNE